MKKIIRTKDGFRVTHMNRRRACRLMCLECNGWDNTNSGVETCNGKMLDGTVCSLVNFRDMSSKQTASERAKAIRAFCLECMGGAISLISQCTAGFCPVYAYRSTTVDKSCLYDENLSDKAILEIGLNRSTNGI
uniref:Uncharacterized protein n=1 Tax=viral metagenome TaxID=1070528 RepID=A0A6M3LRX7_9ZZZZ